ncbi:MAG TPA: response regulator transcription factor [Dehalococcoidia bacterium]|nr:response regulator transcription factor [Dehalococcoidia bacterium]
MKEKILVVDDDRHIVDIVRAYLEKDGYRVVAAYDGRQALEAAAKERPALLILDLMLPELSGWDVMRSLRQTSQVPVIMLTARDDPTDKVVGLELGGDDYVVKPFDPKELLARVRAVLRRTQPVGPRAPITVGQLIIDAGRREVRLGEKRVDLTATEFAVLLVLARHPGMVYTRLQLLEEVQGEAYAGYERAIDSHIKNIRRKLEPDPQRPRYVVTVHGVGYRLEGGDVS